MNFRFFFYCLFIEKHRFFFANRGKYKKPVFGTGLKTLVETTQLLQNSWYKHIQTNRQAVFGCG
jgi:hypothetical protein